MLWGFCNPGLPLRHPRPRARLQVAHLDLSAGRPPASPSPRRGRLDSIKNRPGWFAGDAYWPQPRGSQVVMGRLP
jgi:hypothetical protein